MVLAVNWIKKGVKTIPWGNMSFNKWCCPGQRTFLHLITLMVPVIIIPCVSLTWAKGCPDKGKILFLECFYEEASKGD